MDRNRKDMELCAKSPSLFLTLRTKIEQSKARLAHLTEQTATLRQDALFGSSGSRELCDTCGSLKVGTFHTGHFLTFLMVYAATLCIFYSQELTDLAQTQLEMDQAVPSLIHTQLNL